MPWIKPFHSTFFNAFRIVHDCTPEKNFYIAQLQFVAPDFFTQDFMKKKGIVAQLDSVNEHEREPIPESKLKGLKSFIGMYADMKGFKIVADLARIFKDKAAAEAKEKIGHHPWAT